MRHVVWFSAGAASSVVSMLVLKDNPDAMLFYCDTHSEHPDNVRFIADVEKWLGVSVRCESNPKYANVVDVLLKRKYINGPAGAQCTGLLKKWVRNKFQEIDDIQYFGYCKGEEKRAERFVKSFPEVNARFPLIELGYTKEHCVGVIWKAGIEIPAMYRLGYHNNNCIGCVKGGAGYWNKIRRDFPERFLEMSQVEREVGASCINGTFLDELSPAAGRHTDLEIECDFVCQSIDSQDALPTNPKGTK